MYPKILGDEIPVGLIRWDMDLFRPTHVQVHLDRLMKNFKTLKAFNPENPFICPMIKANAYGHGDVAVAKALSQVGCQHLGVASVEEGLQLRKSHVTETILVFGFTGRAAAKAILEGRLTPVISDFDQFTDLALAATQPFDIHLKLNTGMNRLGFQEKDLAGVLNVLAKNEHFNLVGVGTHFYSGGDLADPQSGAFAQDQCFRAMIAKFPSKNITFHAYNSAAIASLYHKRKGFRFGFRPGLLVYGIDPKENLSIKPLVSPVMEFKSKIVSLQQVKSGDVVSYGGIWQAPKDSTIGIVPAGYADGVCRSLSNCGEFLVKGQRVPIRGRVCMDYTMVDLTELKESAENLYQEEVVLFGKQGDQEISVEEMARQAGRIHYEVLTGISERVPRIYGAKG